jgi:hypothetical protein
MRLLLATLLSLPTSPSSSCHAGVHMDWDGCKKKESSEVSVTVVGWARSSPLRIGQISGFGTFLGLFTSSIL